MTVNAPSLLVDPAATRRRIAKLRRYVATTLLDEGTFICAHHQECRDSRRAGDDFREGIMSHVGRRFDLGLDGKPLRIVIVGQESGSPKGPGSGKLRRRVTLRNRYDQIHNGSGLTRRYYAEPGHPARNPHMRGTTSALRVIFGLGLGADHDGEFVQPTNGRPFHIFDGFALVNRLLCSAGPPGGSRGRPTRTMVRNCRNHFEATLSILEPTLVILQGAGVTQWTRDVLRPSQFDANDYLYEAHLGHGRLIVCTFAHPSAHGMLRWGDTLSAPYLTNVVVPTRSADFDLRTQQGLTKMSIASRDRLGLMLLVVTTAA